MDRSPGFGSSTCNSSPLSDSVSLRLPYSVNLATCTNSLTHYTKGTQSRNKSAPTACMHKVSGSISLPLLGFFSPFPHGTSSLSVSQEYLALEDGPPIFNQPYTWVGLLFDIQNGHDFRYGTITLSRQPFQTILLSCPSLPYRALPVSLATTSRISVDFFSSGYLDVSVPQVRSVILCIQLTVLDYSSGFPHSDTSGLSLICQLPEAFRRLSRLSSPLTAKASTLCTSFLDHITLSMTLQPYIALHALK
jgi:hypothetical protein